MEILGKPISKKMTGGIGYIVYYVPFNSYSRGNGQN